MYAPHLENGVAGVPPDQSPNSYSLGTATGTSMSYGVAILTATAVVVNAGAYDPIVRAMKDPAVWVSSVISQIIGQIIGVLYSALSDPAALLHFFLEQLQHIEIALIHLTSTGLH
jgi:hypothetical protein